MRYLALALSMLPVLASANSINKCVSESGKVLFTQGACPSGQQSEELQIKRANGMNNSANERLGPSAEKYIQPLDLTGDIHQRVRRIKAVVDIGVIKARDCDWSLKVEKATYKCMDLMSYLVEGSTYNQAMQHASELSPDEMAAVTSELRSIVRAAGEVNQAKELMQAYLRAL